MKPFGDIVEGIFSRGALFSYLRLPASLGVPPHIERALDMREGESLLDVGCGTGQYARMARGPYLGIDFHRPYLRYGRRRVKRDGAYFACMDGGRMACADGAFDKAIAINMVHHLDDATVERLLRELRRVVRGRVVLVDADPDSANRFERFLLDHDRGDHIRRRDALHALVARHYEVEREERFHNSIHTVPEILFRLLPSHGPGPSAAAPARS